jgi:hypothetical protein
LRFFIDRASVSNCKTTQKKSGFSTKNHRSSMPPISAFTYGLINKTGLKVESALDTRSYQKGIKVSKAEMKRLGITGDPFHPEWNYTIRPRQS